MFQEEMLSTHQNYLHPKTAHHRMYFAALFDKCPIVVFIHDEATLHAAGNETLWIKFYITALEAWFDKPHLQKGDHCFKFLGTWAHHEQTLSFWW